MAPPGSSNARGQSVFPPGTERIGSGTLIRGYIQAIRHIGKLEEVRARVPPECVRLIDDPPFPIRWIPGPLHDAVLEAVNQVVGDEGSRLVGYDTARNACGKVVEGMMKTLVALSGGAPSGLFTKLDRVVAPLIKGYHFEYRHIDDFSGELELRVVDTMPRSTYVLWEGALRYPLTLARVEGRISPCTPSADGSSALYRLSWKRRGG